MKKSVCFVFLAILIFSGFTDNHADEILGVWANGTNRGHIELYKQDAKYYGKIVWLKQPNDETGKPKVDKNNPNPTVRTKRLLGLVMLRDFTYEDGEWTGGKIYNPTDGKEYSCNMTLKDPKTLAVRGYLGISLIGKTEKFTRVR
jgi:uncharacterized protein (DUF2147 family)